MKPSVSEKILPIKAGLLCCLLRFGTLLFTSQDSPANSAPILETGSSFQKQVETGKLIDSSFTLNAVFCMKRIAGYKLKCCSLLGLMVVLVIFKYSVCMCKTETGRETDMEIFYFFFIKNPSLTPEVGKH